MKNKITTLSLIIFSIFLSHTLYSQKNYLPGYIVNIDGDTLKGFIDYRNWGRNPDKISFQETDGSKSTDYIPIEIRGFGVSDEIYESAIVNMEDSPLELSELTFSSDLILRKDTVFLQTMINGSKKLYHYKDNKDLFYIKEDSKFELLVFKKYKVERSQATIVKEYQLFLGQLSKYLEDCKVISSKLESVTYTKKSLEKLFSYYYECTESKPLFQKKTEKVRTEFGVMAGLSATDIFFKSNTSSSVIGAGFTPSYNFSAGLFLNVIFPRSRGKWSIYNDLLYTSFSFKGSSETDLLTYNTMIGFSYLQINNQLRFKFPIVGTFFGFINAGISNGFVISETNQTIRTIKSSPTNIISERALDATKPFEQSFLFGTGLMYNRFSIEFRFARGSGVSNVKPIQSISYRFFLLLGFKF